VTPRRVLTYVVAVLVLLVVLAVVWTASLAGI
jgi:hypothetical protein